MPELGAQLPEVRDHPTQIPPPLDQRTVDARDVVDRRVEAPQAGGELLRMAVQALRSALIAAASEADQHSRAA